MQDAIISSHHLNDVIFKMMLFFGIAGILVPSLQKLKISPILAYLLCGICIGPFGFAAIAQDVPWVKYISIQEIDTVQLLGELGIIALMFMIGLELSLQKLKELKHYILGLGTAQIVITSVVLFGIFLTMGYSKQTAVLLGACFSLSSTAIVLKLLEEKKLMHRPIGVLSFSILLMQDLAVIPILVLAAAFSGTQQANLVDAITFSIFQGIIVVALLYWLGLKLLRATLNWISFSRNPEWLIAFTVFIVISCAIITSKFGLSLALGAFLAGLLISETEFKHEVEVIIAPLKSLLIGIFFLSVGMTINIQTFLNNPVPIILGVMCIFVVKTLVLFPLCLIFDVPARKAMQVSVIMAHPGEFALMILGVLAASHFLPVDDIQYFTLVVVISMLCVPFIFQYSKNIGKIATRLSSTQSDTLELPMLNEKVVIIAGFGRVGQILGTSLVEQGIPYLAFDNNAERVRMKRIAGFRVIFGDATRKALWARLHSGNVIAAVIAIDDSEASHKIIDSIRKEWPLLPVIVRAKDTCDMNTLYDLGAQFVVTETLETSLSMARILMNTLDNDDATTEKILNKIRERTIINPDAV